MKKFWLVFWNEYRRHVFRRRFVVIVLSLPVFFLLAGLVAALSTAAIYNPRPVGYVDQGGWLSKPVPPRRGDSAQLFAVEIRPYPDEASALADLKNGRLQVYYVLPAGYLESGQARLVAQKPLTTVVESQFREFLRANLLAGQREAVARRVMEGMNLTYLRPWRDAQSETPGWFILLLPMTVGVIFLVVINTSGGYILQAVTDEKENRTIEVVITSVSPEQLMAGKVLGSLCVGLTQLLVWVAFPLAAFFALRGQFPGLANLRIEPQMIWVSGLTLLGSFVLIAGLMAGVGATAAESREAQQIASIFTLPVMIPYAFLATLVLHPNSPLARILSFFPLTAVVTLPIRVVFAHLTSWEIALNLGLLYAAAFTALWLAGRAFRLGMLRYGKPVRLKELFGKR